MTLVPGVETIVGLVGEPPAEIELDRNDIRKQGILIRSFNKACIGIIPYCYKCKVPLVWHIPPDDNEMFTCPNCGRVWVLKEGYR